MSLVLAVSLRKLYRRKKMKSIDDCETPRDRITFILEDIAKNGLPGPRDLDVAIEALFFNFKELIEDMSGD